MEKRNLNKVVLVLLVFFLCAFPVSMYAAKENNSNASKDKISEELYQEFTRLKAEGKNLEKEKIPVWIWYKDIDQKRVDREVTKQLACAKLCEQAR